MSRLQTTAGLSMWLAGNAGLAILMDSFSFLAMAHSGLVVVAVLIIGARGTPTTVATLAGYICGTEIIWRMSGGRIPWLLGEYLLILLLGFAVLRWRRRPPLAGLLYLVPQLLSVPLTFGAIGSLEASRQAVAFNLAGPAALFMMLWFASATSRRNLNIQNAVWAFLGPCFGVAVLALGSLLSAEAVEFTDASNFVASGGYGPNQVASVLSLGLLLVLLDRFVLRWRGKKGFLMLGLAGFLAFQAALTFSRSGLAMVAGAFAVTLTFAFRRRRQRITVLVSGAVTAVMFALVLVPSLERVTSGGFSQRYTDPSLTGRETIAKSDLEMFWENPVLGVGPGVATYMRVTRSGHQVAGHTEFTRLLAEHGAPGLVSLLALAAVVLQLMKGAGRATLGSVTAGLAVWVLLYMSVNAFRLSLPVLALGLALAIKNAVLNQQPGTRHTLAGWHP